MLQPHGPIAQGQSKRRAASQAVHDAATWSHWVATGWALGMLAGMNRSEREARVGLGVLGSMLGPTLPFDAQAG